MGVLWSLCKFGIMSESFVYFISFKAKDGQWAFVNFLSWYWWFDVGFTSRSVSRNGYDISSSSRNSSTSITTAPRSEGEILQSSNLKSFSYNDLRAATKNFRPDSVLGEGGFGSVFKGWIDEHSLVATKPGIGMIIAVKRLNQDGLQGHKEWLVSINYFLETWSVSPLMHTFWLFKF